MNWSDGRSLNFATAERKVSEMASRRVIFHFRSDRMSSLLVEVRKSAWMTNWLGFVKRGCRNVMDKQTYCETKGSKG
jgi:hypothetical protein